MFISAYQNSNILYLDILQKPFIVIAVRKQIIPLN